VARCYAGLTELILNRNGLTQACAGGLARALARRPHLSALRLHRNDLGDGGATHLAQALGEGCGLCELVLSENRIGDDGALAIGKALGRGRGKLIKLDLSHNDIADTGTVALCDGLVASTAAGTPPLQALKLPWNKMGDASGIALGTLLGQTPSLRVLQLQNNALGAKSGDALTAGALANGHITTIGVDGNVLPYPAIVKLQEATLSNKKRGHGNLSARAATKLDELQHVAGQLEAAEKEYERLCGRRRDAEESVVALTTALADEDASEVERAREGKEQRGEDTLHLETAVRQLKELKAKLADQRTSWAQQLDQLSKRLALEGTRVKGLEERFADEVKALKADEHAAAERTQALVEQCRAASRRADQREASMREAEALMVVRRDELQQKGMALPGGGLPRPTDADALRVTLEPTTYEEQMAAADESLFPESYLVPESVHVPPPEVTARPNSARPSASAPAANGGRPQSATARR